MKFLFDIKWLVFKTLPENKLIMLLWLLCLIWTFQDHMLIHVPISGYILPFLVYPRLHPTIIVVTSWRMSRRSLSGCKWSCWWTTQTPPPTTTPRWGRTGGYGTLLYFYLFWFYNIFNTNYIVTFKYKVHQLKVTRQHFCGCLFALDVRNWQHSELFKIRFSLVFLDRNMELTTNWDLLVIEYNNFSSSKTTFLWCLLGDSTCRWFLLFGHIILHRWDDLVYLYCSSASENVRRAMSQPQPSFRRAPGTPTMSIRNKPPSMLQVSH